MKKREIEEALLDYRWMLNEIKRLRQLLGDAGDRVVRSYEAMDMPKPQGGRTDPVGMEASRRERQWKRLSDLERKVKYIQEHIENVQDERERTVLDCVLDGMSILAIAQHMGLSRGHVGRLRDSIVERMQEKTPA